MRCVVVMCMVMMGMIVICVIIMGLARRRLARFVSVGLRICRREVIWTLFRIHPAGC